MFLDGALDGEEEFQGEGMDEDADVECFGMEIVDGDGPAEYEEDEDDSDG
jgi:hypothetical protein